MLFFKTHAFLYITDTRTQTSSGARSARRLVLRLPVGLEPEQLALLPPGLHACAAEAAREARLEMYLVVQVQRGAPEQVRLPEQTYLFRPHYFFIERDDFAARDASRGEAEAECEAKYPEAGRSGTLEVGGARMAFFGLRQAFGAAAAVEDSSKKAEMFRLVEHEQREPG